MVQTYYFIINLVQNLTSIRETWGGETYFEAIVESKYLGGPQLYITFTSESCSHAWTRGTQEGSFIYFPYYHWLGTSFRTPLLWWRSAQYVVCPHPLWVRKLRCEWVSNEQWAVSMKCAYYHGQCYVSGVMLRIFIYFSFTF